MSMKISSLKLQHMFLHRWKVF